MLVVSNGNGNQISWFHFSQFHNWVFHAPVTTLLDSHRFPGNVSAFPLLFKPLLSYFQPDLERTRDVGGTGVSCHKIIYPEMEKTWRIWEITVHISLITSV